MVSDFQACWVDLQIKCFIPGWTVRSVQCMRANPCVAHFKHGKRIAVAYSADTMTKCNDNSLTLARAYPKTSDPLHCSLQTKIAQHDNNT